LERTRSTLRIVHAKLDVKFWLAQLPSVEEVRPGRCPACRAPSRLAGSSLGLHGHGLRSRQQRGPRAPDDEPVTVVVDVRRYECQHCGAVITVVPRDVEPRRHYSRPAIALALARFGLLGESPAAVRRAVSPWRVVGAAAAGMWITLGRWIVAVRRGTLLRQTRASPLGATARQIAERAAQGAAAHAPPTLRHLPIVAQVFHGASHMAR